MFVNPWTGADNYSLLNRDKFIATYSHAII